MESAEWGRCMAPTVLSRLRASPGAAVACARGKGARERKKKRGLLTFERDERRLWCCGVCVVLSTGGAVCLGGEGESAWLLCVKARRALVCVCVCEERESVCLSRSVTVSGFRV